MQDFFKLGNLASDEEARAWLMADAKNMLLAELYIAELQARKGGKRKTFDTHGFEVHKMENLLRLRESLYDLSYEPSRGTAHVIFNPVQREIFAAPYRDRVVHHLIVNTIDPWWNSRLNDGSCSCRVGKGTSYGIERLRHNIASVSRNGKEPCYIIKMDISGYFMHIRRDIMCERVIWGLDRQFRELVGPEWQKSKRYKIVRHAIEAVIFDDPVRDVKIQGSYEDWRGLPEDKSLFCQPKGRGMVIGNLTSQDFSNIYLDTLDRFIAITLGYRYYVRYVDDFCIVVPPEQLEQAKRDIGAIANFLQGLGLSLNKKKTQIFRSTQGVPFLGMVIRNGAVMPGKRMTRNFSYAAHEVVSGIRDIDSIVSYLGMLIHYDAGKVCDKIFQSVGWEYNF